MNAEWQNASINFALQNVATVTRPTSSSRRSAMAERLRGHAREGGHPDQGLTKL